MNENNWYVTREFDGVTYAIEFVWPDGTIEWSPLSADEHIVTFTYEEACEFAEDGVGIQVKQYQPQFVDVDEVWLIKPLTLDDEDYEHGVST